MSPGFESSDIMERFMVMWDVSEKAHHIPHYHKPLHDPGGPKSKHSQSKSRSNTSLQPPSLLLPSSPAFNEAEIVRPSAVEQRQGFFDLEDELVVGVPV